MIGGAAVALANPYRTSTADKACDVTSIEMAEEIYDRHYPAELMSARAHARVMHALDMDTEAQGDTNVVPGDTRSCPRRGSHGVAMPSHRGVVRVHDLPALGPSCRTCSGA